MIDNETTIGLLIAIPFFGMIALWLTALTYDRLNDRDNDQID